MMQTEWGDLSVPANRRRAIRRIGEEISTINQSIQAIVRSGTRALSDDETAQVAGLREQKERLEETRESINDIGRAPSEENLRYERAFMTVAKKHLDIRTFSNLHALARQLMEDTQRRRGVVSQATGSVVTPNAGVAGWRERK
jgi:hypothetical protein